MPRNRLVESLLVLLLLAVYWTLAVSAARTKSTTVDELSHLTAGYSYWHTQDFRLFPVAGIMPQMWAALPLVAAGDVRFPDLEREDWRRARAASLGYEYFYRSGNDPRWMLERSRAMIAILGALLGLTIYLASRHRFGPAGGFLSLSLFVFDPGMLAHGALVTTDMALALFLTISVACFWRMLETPGVRTVAAAALSVSVLFLSKVSAALFLPMAAIALALRTLAGRSRSAWAASVVLAVLVTSILWGAYGFRYAAIHPTLPGTMSESWDDLLAHTGALAAPVRVASELALLPEAFLYAYADAVANARRRPAFLDGDHSWNGWWYFFPYCFFVKTPIPFQLVLLLAAATAVIDVPGDRRKPGRRVSTAPYWVLLAVYSAFAIASNVNIGHRHILAIYPALFILAGAAVRWRRSSRGAVRVLPIALPLLLVFDSMLIRPHYLAYFNAFAGGPAAGYRRLVDSSLDWGQDLPALAVWLEENGYRNEAADPVYLSYFGGGNPGVWGIEARLLPGYPEFRDSKEVFPLTGGVYAISATMLQGVLLRAQGPWSESHERTYQALLEEIGSFSRSPDPAFRQEQIRRHGESYWAERFGLFDDYRLARLCAYLRKREPDAFAGYSILIFRLTDGEVEKAIFGPSV